MRLALKGKPDFGTRSEPERRVNASPALTKNQPWLEGLIMADEQATPARLPFQPRPGCDDLLSVLLLWRLAERVVAREGGCWEWIGGRTSAGYGTIAITTKLAGRVNYVHRLVAALCVGEVTPALTVIHRCDNPCCCRPEHLVIGTQQDNVADMIAKGRRNLRPAVGEDVGGARLTVEVVTRMRLRHKEGRSIGSLAREAGVSHRTAQRAIQRLTWRHVP